MLQNYKLMLTVFCHTRHHRNNIVACISSYSDAEQLDVLVLKIYIFEQFKLCGMKFIFQSK